MNPHRRIIVSFYSFEGSALSCLSSLDITVQLWPVYPTAHLVDEVEQGRSNSPGFEFVLRTCQSFSLTHAHALSCTHIKIIL